jgi:transcriptional regulator with XRE-family HTH domain
MDDASTIDDARTVGARIKVLRKWRRMTQQTVAELAEFSQPFLSQVERGQMALDRRSHIAGLARALNVSEADIIGGPHLSGDPAQLDAYASIPALRMALQSSSIGRPAIDMARPLPELATERNVTVERLIRLCDYAGSGNHLPSLIEELHFHAFAPRDEPALRLALETLVEAYANAAEMARHAGQRDLASVASIKALQAADILDDPVQKGKAAMWHLLNMPHEGTSSLAAWERTHIAAKDAVDQLEPHAREPRGIQVLGMLTLMTSLTAAAMKQHETAKTWLGEADDLARRVDDELDHNWMGFSTTNVGLWRIAIGVERGESGGAVLEMAKPIHSEKLNHYRSRKAAFFSDVGRALARERKTLNDSVPWLRRAETAAPAFIRNNMPVRHTCEVLHGKNLAPSMRVELRGMMARMGIPH